jgi:hypothetical protein
MLKLINGKWVYEDPPKHPKVQKRIDEHLNYLSKCYLVESTIFGACFYNGAKSPYWKYNNLITD